MSLDLGMTYINKNEILLNKYLIFSQLKFRFKESNTDFIFFFLLKKIPSLSVYHIFFSIHLSWFYLLAFVAERAADTEVRVPLQCGDRAL